MTALEILPFGGSKKKEAEEAEGDETPKKTARKPRAKKAAKESDE